MNLNTVDTQRKKKQNGWLKVENVLKDSKDQLRALKAGMECCHYIIIDFAG